ncbi:MAG TPA: SRPBCC family protein [Burkholderiales bacterium]|nr:SRPBCC family protein [Burkholderiales bacterium]
MKAATASFSLVTVWELEAALERVWEAIYRAEDWPRWWPYVERVVKLQEGDGNGVGAVRRLTWRTRLPYRITFETRATHVEKPFRLEGEAMGELAGTGRWTLSHSGTVTTVRYDWNVRATKPWMARLAPLARPIFEWNHNGVMRAGGEGLARHLGVRLLQA